MNTPSIISVAVALPDQVVTNADITAAYPEAVADARRGSFATTFAPPSPAAPPAAEVMAFDRHRRAHAGDPFGGSVQRRVLAAGETSVDLAVRVATEALSAAGGTSADIDLLICTAAPPDRLFPGDAADVAARLGVPGAAFNVESWNAGFLVGLEVAVAMLAAGHRRRALVVGSATYSRMSPPHDSFSWFVGDSAAATVLDAGDPSGARLVGASIRATPEALRVFDLTAGNTGGRNRLRLNPTPRVRTELVPSTLRDLGRTGAEALASAGLSPRDLDVLIGYGSTGWMARTCADIVGVPTARTVDVHPVSGNVGPVLPALGLVAAAASGLLVPGRTVLLQATGPDSCTASLCLSWGRVALGPVPVGLDWGEQRRAS